LERNRSFLSFAGNAREQRSISQEYASYVHARTLLREIGEARGMKGRYPRYGKTLALRRKFGELAGVSAANYAQVGYALFTHRGTARDGFARIRC